MEELSFKSSSDLTKYLDSHLSLTEDLWGREYYFTVREVKTRKVIEPAKGHCESGVEARFKTKIDSKDRSLKYYTILSMLFYDMVDNLIIRSITNRYFSVLNLYKIIYMMKYIICSYHKFINFHFLWCKNIADLTIYWYSLSFNI